VRVVSRCHPVNIDNRFSNGRICPDSGTVSTSDALRTRMKRGGMRVDRWMDMGVMNPVATHQLSKLGWDMGPVFQGLPPPRLL